MQSSNTKTVVRALTIIFVSLCFQLALAQSKKRIIPFPEWSLDEEGEAQLELVEIKIALAKEDEGAFCKLEFIAPAIQYKDGTSISFPNMRFHGKQ